MILDNNIFVFGSNEAGIHGAGAALYAYRNHGAIPYLGEGLMGSCYAIPTKDRQIRSLCLEDIQDHVLEFLYFADISPELTFNVTPIGCGLAGYTPKDIAPMFKNSPPNVILPQVFIDVLSNST